MPPYRNSLTPEEIKLEYQKRKARNILTTALAKGEIQRLPCAVCGHWRLDGFATAITWRNTRGFERMEMFEDFWKSYPRKVGRMKAEKLWGKLTFSEKMLVQRGLTLWKQTAQWHENDGIYIPYASTFLAQKRYLDEPWHRAFE